PIAQEAERPAQILLAPGVHRGVRFAHGPAQRPADATVVESQRSQATLGQVLRERSVERARHAHRRPDHHRPMDGSLRFAQGAGERQVVQRRKDDVHASLVTRRPSPRVGTKRSPRRREGLGDFLFRTPPSASVRGSMVIPSSGNAAARQELLAPTRGACEDPSVRSYDLLVIGGGVNGTGIARDAAMRGLRTMLVEKKDFAAGSSGANSGMIHGGIRYLMTDPQVTRLSCLDSGYIQKIAPHLLFRIPFLYPVQPSRPGHPSLKDRAFLYGADIYFEAYDRYQPLKNGKAHTRLTDEVRARVVFNAGGPWAPRIAALAGVEVKIRPSKGVHVTLDRRLSNYGIICKAIDGRDVFVMPHEDSSIIGTTDDDFYGDPDDLFVTQDEVQYLLQAVEHTFPAVRKARVLRAWAGIRPTLYAYGPLEDALSRDHAIYDHEKDGAPGFFSIVGGKLASFRAM